jgi:hypothetical protein
MSFGGEPTLRQANAIQVECCDCGHSRWRRPSELVGNSVTLNSTIRDVSKKFFCKPCREEGLPGKHVSVSVAFALDVDRQRAEAAVLRNQVVLSSGSRATAL